MVGELTVTLVGTYNTLALAIADWDAGTDATPATDNHELHILDGGSGRPTFALIKIVKTAA